MQLLAVESSRVTELMIQLGRLERFFDSPLWPPQVPNYFPLTECRRKAEARMRRSTTTTTREFANDIKSWNRLHL